MANHWMDIYCNVYSIPLMQCIQLHHCSACKYRYALRYSCPGDCHLGWRLQWLLS